MAKFPYLMTLDGATIEAPKNSQYQLNQNDEKKYEKIIGVITFDQKYADDAVKSVKTRS